MPNTIAPNEPSLGFSERRAAFQGAAGGSVVGKAIPSVGRYDPADHLDRLNYHEAWIGEHHSGGFELIASPEMFIAAAAQRTKHIRLGTPQLKRIHDRHEAGRDAVNLLGEIRCRGFAFRGG